MNRRQAAGLGAVMGMIGGVLSYPLLLRDFDFPTAVVLAAINAVCCGLTDAIVASMVVARIDMRFKPGPLSARILSSVSFGASAGFIGGGFVGFFIGILALLVLSPGGGMFEAIPTLTAFLGALTAGAIGLPVGGICGATAKPRTGRK